MRFIETLEPRRLLSVSPAVQVDMNVIHTEASSLLRDVKRLKTSTKLDVRKLKIDFRQASQSQKHLLNVFKADLARGQSDLNESLSFVRHLVGHDLPEVVSALNSLQRRPGNSSGDALLSNAISWLTTDGQEGGLLGRGLLEIDNASSGLSTIAASLPTNAPALRDVAKAQTDVTNVDNGLHQDSALLGPAVHQLIIDASS